MRSASIYLKPAYGQRGNVRCTGTEFGSWFGRSSDEFRGNLILGSDEYGSAVWRISENSVCRLPLGFVECPQGMGN